MSQETKKSARRKNVPLHVYITPEMVDALRLYVASTSPAVTTTAAVRVAMGDFLTRHGFWQPSQEGK